MNSPRPGRDDVLRTFFRGAIAKFAGCSRMGPRSLEIYEIISKRMMVAVGTMYAVDPKEMG